MKNFTTQLIRYRRLEIALFLAITLILGDGILNVSINADFSTYLQEDDPVVQKFNLIGEVYASKSLALVLIEAADVFSPETLTLIQELTDAYEVLDDLAYVTSLMNVTDIKDADGSIEVGSLISEWDLSENQEERNKLRNYVLSKERYVRDIVSEDGTLTAIVIRLMPDIYEFETANTIKEVTEAIAPDLAQISYGGLPFMMHQMTLNIMSNMTYLQPVMFLLMIIVLFLGFRKIGGVALPLVVVAFTIIWTIGLMAIFDLELNMLTAAVANLWFLIETEDIMEQMVREDEAEGLIQAKLDTWDTEILAEAMEQVQQFVATLPEKLFIVNLAEAAPALKDTLLTIRAERITDTLFWDLQKHRIAVDRAQLAQIVAAALAEQGYPEDTERRVRQAIVRYLLGPTAEVASVSEVQATNVARVLLTELKTHPPPEQDPILTHLSTEIPQAESEEDLRALAVSVEFVMREAIGEAQVASALDAIVALLPNDAKQNSDLLKALKGDLWEMNETLMVVGNQDYNALPVLAEATAVNEFPISVEATGLAAVLKRMEEELLPSQFQSLLVALVAVTVMMALIFRSFSIGVIAMLPTTLTIVINFAVMAALNIGLDSFTAMIASIAIGLGIDTDIHFISSFKREFAKLGDELKALQATFSTTGVAILINALTVGLGFGVLLLAGGQHVRRFGGLVSLTILLSALLSLSILPAVLLAVKPAFLRVRKHEEPQYNQVH